MCVFVCVCMQVMYSYQQNHLSTFLHFWLIFTYTHTYTHTHTQNREAWGIRTFFSTAGFREFLVSRSSEQDKESKEWKYSLVEVCVHVCESEGESKGMLNEEIMSELKEYLRMGPFYVGRQAEVETMM